MDWGFDSQEWMQYDQEGAMRQRFLELDGACATDEWNVSSSDRLVQ